MRIGLDLRMVDGGSGIGRYVTELSHEILKQDQKNEYVLFFYKLSDADDYEQYSHKKVITGIKHYSLAEQTKLPGVLYRENLDIVHFPHFNVPLFYRKLFVVTIHDLTHTLFPGRKKMYALHRLAYRVIFRNAILKAQKIIAVSNATKKAILEHFHVDAQKIQVVYEGINQAYKIVDKLEAFDQVSYRFRITKPYIMYVGVWRRYKNLPALAVVFDKLVDKGLDFELVLAGDKDANYPEIESQVMGIKNHDRIKAVGRVSDEDLNLLYNAAQLFVLPSLIEGFGLTALEAAACGTPIVCSDIATLREIMGQGAEYFDPNNIENMTDVLFSLLKDEKRLEELANLALSRSKHFSWKKAGEETINFYQSL
jgi:glycosyltransferase involved in cell wall biosynthesis